MNYVELFIGDYLRDTGELSLAEHGAYLKLMLSYYATERALPPSLPALYRICTAMTAPERQAVATVAGLYFPVAADGLRHKSRCDEEIEKAQRRIEAAKANGKHGGRPRKETQEKPTGFQSANPAETQSGEALHAPHATSKDSLPKQAPIPHSPTEAGRACRLMRDAGCSQSNPSHPDLIAALAEGVTPEALADTVAEGVAAGKAKPFAWAISTARSRHAEGSRPVITGSPRTFAPSKSHNALTAILGVTHDQPQPDSRVVLDVDPRGSSEPSRSATGRLSGS